MRKMLMRIYLDVCSPGGPWALEVKTATRDVVTGATLENVRGTLTPSVRFAASVSLSEIALEVVREWTAQ
jgi:hypothetical protein